MNGGGGQTTSIDRNNISTIEFCKYLFIVLANRIDVLSIFEKLAFSRPKKTICFLQEFKNFDRESLNHMPSYRSNNICLSSKQFLESNLRIFCCFMP